MRDPIAPYEPDDRDLPLRQAARVLVCSRRRMDAGEGDPVLKNVQQRRHVVRDAGVEQLLVYLVAAQLGQCPCQPLTDLPSDPTTDDSLAFWTVAFRSRPKTASVPAPADPPMGERLAT